MPRLRPRISLLTTLLLVTIAGMGIVIVQLWREVGPLRSEVRRLRDEVGALTIDDPTKLSAIRVRTPDEFTWKWRLWIPETRSYRLRMAGEAIPKAGIPAGNGMITLDNAGETWIQYRIATDPRSGQWQDKLETPSASVGSSPQEWVKWPRRTSTSEGVGHTTQHFEPGKIIVLARMRVSQNANSSTNIEDPSAGFMIWLKPVK